MAYFLGELEGQGPSVCKRHGSKDSGMSATIHTKSGVVRLVVWTDKDGKDWFRVKQSVNEFSSNSGVEQAVAVGIIGENYEA